MPLVFVSAFAAMVFVNYTIQTTFIPALVGEWSPEKESLLAALTMAKPTSLGWVLEMWGYAMLGIATWLSAPVLGGGRLERAAGILFAANGPFSILGALATSARPGWVLTTGGIVSFAAWNLLVVVMTVLVLVSYRPITASLESGLAT